MRILALCATAFAVAVFATGTKAQSFPDGAASISANELQQKLAGKRFTMNLADGTIWRVEYKTTGAFLFNSGNFSDTGDWNVEEGRLCSKGRKIGASCNDVRAKDGTLYLKRDNGEIVQFVPQ